MLPIDDSDMGCDCEVKCEIRAPWTRQIAAIEIADGDAITDDGQETWNLLAERGIDNVILCGVHLNMCVLGRPFAIRQMVDLGKNVALMRDMTDTMYNPEQPPGVSHFDGTDLVVEHVEKYWCPSFSAPTSGPRGGYLRQGLDHPRRLTAVETSPFRSSPRRGGPSMSEPRSGRVPRDGISLAGSDIGVRDGFAAGQARLRLSVHSPSQASPDYSHPMMQPMIKGASARSTAAVQPRAESPYPCVRSCRFRPLRGGSSGPELTRWPGGRRGADRHEVIQMRPACR